ncbi:hypothetical protein VPH35_042095 [Triticum aestivum]
MLIACMVYYENHRISLLTVVPMPTRHRLWQIKNQNHGSREKTLIAMYAFRPGLVHLGSPSRWTRWIELETASFSGRNCSAQQCRRVLPPEPRTTSRLLPVPMAQQPSKLMDLAAHHRQ